jgi:hypothetical protein
MIPETRYARSGDVGIAYRVVGEGEMDLVVAFPISRISISSGRAHDRPFHSAPRLVRAGDPLRPQRGGASDPVAGAATLEERMDDVRAVMDAAGSERAAAGSGISFEPRGRHALKGVADEWDVYEVSPRHRRG